MNTLNELCVVAEQTGSASFPLQQACAHPRIAADEQLLPLPHGESAFDSSWEAIMPEALTTASPSSK